MFKKVPLIRPVITILALLTIGATLAPAQDEESPLSFEITSDIYSKYVWRGINLTDDWVWQPGASGSLDVGVGSVSLGVWGNMDLTDVNDNDKEFNEVDYSLDFSYTVAEKINISHGLIFYDFPNTEYDSTWEVYTAIGLDVPLAPTLTGYYDLDEIEGIYLTFDLSHSVPIVDEDSMSVSLDLGSQVGYGDDDHNMGYYGAGSGFTNLNLTAGVSVGVGEHFSFGPSVTWSRLLDGEIRDAMGYDDEWYYGLSMSVAF
ncbi:hypothetical protein JXA32_17145 [Candidatus Sumerlaeota bacterium]|nr:hypothetical protein [Candidatus Sumerlaeota bacterium]